jgi:putative DNA primase/helicase
MTVDANDILKARGPDALRDVFDTAPRKNGQARANPSPAPSVNLLPGTAYNLVPVRWLWRDWLACGKFHLLAGAAGTGKTTIGISLAAAITSGGRWPDGSPAGPPGDVLIWSGEDGIADTLLPRFVAAGGDRARVHFIDGITERGKPRPFDPARDMPHLEKAIGELASVELLILDPVVSAVSGDSHKNSETRRGLQPVVDLADKLGCGVLGITHLTKNTSGRDPLERVSGSLAFGALARVVLVTVRDADQEKPRRLVRAKSNIGPDTGGLCYTFCSVPVPGYDFHNQRVEWGEPLEGTARELMSVEEQDDAGDALEDAEAFLVHILEDGPIATKEIKTAAAAHGHRWRTVERAKGTLGVTATKEGFAGGWAWKLSEMKTANPDEDRQHD